MDQEWNHLWLLVIAAGALAGWWLSVRPDATFRGISPTMSVLIVLMAVLMCVLALNGQSPQMAPQTTEVTYVMALGYPVH